MRCCGEEEEGRDADGTKEGIDAVGEEKVRDAGVGEKG